MAVTTENIMDALYGITYSTSSYTKARRFQVVEDDFENFDSFPLIVVTSGMETNRESANGVVTTEFHPGVEFYGEDIDAETMEGWRESIRNAIYNDTTLRGYCMDQPSIDSITPGVSPNRKLQRFSFSLTTIFDNSH